MPKSIYVEYLTQRHDSNPHYLNRLVRLLTHYISIEPPKKTKGFEDHHIVPKAKSWKPEWDKIPENHLRVPVKAHYVIHHLMWKAFPFDRAMRYAFWMTFIGQQRQRITAKVYESIKRNLSHSEETRAKMKVLRNQRPPVSEETRLAISIGRKRETCLE